MKKLIYTPDAIEKLQDIEQYLKIMFGSETAAEVKNSLRSAIRTLKTTENIGSSVRDVYGIDTDYRKLFINHYHIFYRIEPNVIRIIAIFHEREDFIRKMFGSDGSSNC